MAALSSDTGWEIGARNARMWADTFHRNLPGEVVPEVKVEYWCSGGPASGAQVLGGFKRQLRKVTP